MAGNLEQMQDLKLDGTLMAIRDQLALIAKNIETQNEILRKLTLRLTGDSVQLG
jgi:hypothetical protein